MSDIRFVSAFTLIGVGLLSNSSAYALGVGTIDRSPLDKNYLHTSTPSTEPAPLFAQLDKAYKTAGICFLGVGDCAPNAGFDNGGDDDGDYDVNTGNQCLNEGFTPQSCNSVQTIDGVCPYNSAYGRGCKCASNLISCPAGQVGVGDSCDGKYASCKCDPNLKTCSSKEVGQGASCGGKYESCVCKPEYQYTSSNCTYPRSVSGDNCSGKYINCICPSGVSEGPYGCEEYYPSPCNSACKIAYPDNCHIRPDNNSQLYGCMKWWDDCKTKCETPYKDNCRNQTAVSIPANASCTSYYSDCSSKCSAWACNDGYNQSGGGCVLADPCPGYYECGGRWQYCEGKTCSADSSKCSVYCENDMFPYSCNDSSQCEGAYRDGYCSVDTCYEDELVAWNADRSFVDCGYPWTGGEGYCEVGFKCCCEFSISGEVCKNLSIITEQDYDYDWEIDEECESSCPSFLY